MDNLKLQVSLKDVSWTVDGKGVTKEGDTWNRLARTEENLLLNKREVSRSIIF